MQQQKEVVKDQTIYADIMNRRMIIRVSPESMANVFCNWIHQDYTVLPLIKELPANCWCRSVWYDELSKCFCLEMMHQSFDEVAFGAMAPLMDYKDEHIFLKRVP